MTHICVSKLTIIGSDNGLSPARRQAIIWTNAGILLIRPLGTNFNEMWIEILIFSFMKMRLNVSSAKWRPFCLNVLKTLTYDLSMSKISKMEKALVTPLQAICTCTVISIFQIWWKVMTYIAFRLRRIIWHTWLIPSCWTAQTGPWVCGSNTPPMAGQAHSSHSMDSSKSTKSLQRTNRFYQLSTSQFNV